MTEAEREKFDAIFDRVLHDLPQNVRDLFDESPLILEDRPSKAILRDFGLDDQSDTLCGLYTGTPVTERSVEGIDFPPDHIYVFREGVVAQAGGWEAHIDEDGEAAGGEEKIANEIRITILHELGHHFGLDEDDLLHMGYE